jgi:SAM-dependent methyltransferase
LSWARRGARVTGVDFSSEAIEYARTLARETGVAAEFVCSDLYAASGALPPATFDIVYTSYGVLAWLPDLAPWAALIAGALRPGGTFYIVEGHPTARVFPIDEDMPQAKSFRPWFSYFHEPAGIRWPAAPDYADPGVVNTGASHEWQHSMSDIINALIVAGLRIEWLHEFPFCAWKVVAGCVELERSGAGPAYYGQPPSEPRLPLMFSLRASKPLTG